MKNILITLCLLFSILTALAAQELPHSKPRHPGIKSPSPQLQKRMDHYTQTLNRSGTHTFAGGVDTAWVRHFMPAKATPHALIHGLAIAPDGALYIGGAFWNTLDSSELVLVKSDSTGRPVWSTRSTGRDASAPAVDMTGNVYVTGIPSKSGVGHLSTVKYNSSGQEVWERSLEGTGSRWDWPTGVCLDDKDFAYVAGYATDPFWRTHIIACKYSPSGDTLWTVRCYSTLSFRWGWNFGDVSISQVLDRWGNLYLAGTVPDSRGLADYFTAKLSPGGKLCWTRQFNGSADQNDIACDIAVDTSGSVYITGSCNGEELGLYGSYSDDWATVKYDSSGLLRWVQYYGAPIHYTDWQYSEGYDNAVAMRADDRGNIFVIGSVDQYDWDLSVNDMIVPCPNNMATVKYAWSGDTVWTRKRTGPGLAARSLVLDSEGSAYVTGIKDSTLITVKYHASGREEWVATYRNDSAGVGSSAASGIDSQGNLILAFDDRSAGEGTITLVKYVCIKTSIHEVSAGVPKYFELSQNYPNPFNPETKIEFSIPKSSIVNLKIYDLLGRQVAVLVNQQKPAGRYTVKWDASRFSSGIYFYELSAGEYRSSKKMILIK